jgi:hypothetical protein
VAEDNSPLTELLTDDELAAFSRDLEEWAARLPSRHRAFLRQLLVDALEAAVEDVSGFVEPSAFLDYQETATEDFAVASTATITAIVAAYVKALAAEAEDDPAPWFRPPA